ncbi:MAG: MYXO-CTERM sorting domain-containing protein [Myxococcota bacterium]|nr:MYXO-CTERM sorting domain-containing protein [Myxococcota bacterium]
MRAIDLLVLVGVLVGPTAGAAVRTTQELQAAVQGALPGAVIEVMPGLYDLPGPLVLAQPGPVTLRGMGRPEETSLVVGGNREVVRVLAPGWTLSRLTLRGGIGIRVEEEGDGLRLDALRITDAHLGIELGDPADLLCALSGLVFSNNVLANIRTDAIQLNSVCDIQILHHTVWNVGRPLLVQGMSRPPRLVNNLWSAPVPVAGEGDLILPVPAFAGWFVSTARLDLRLVRGSPAVDRGVAAPVPHDADGRRRPLGAAPDVGAYELDPSAGGDMSGQDGSAVGATVPMGGSTSSQGRLREGGISCAATPGSGPNGPSWAAALLLALVFALRHRVLGR